MADVFVSYASADKQFADRVVAALEGEGVACFCAPRDIVAGLPYGEAIMRGLRGCQAFVVIVSQHSVDSLHVGNEVERAVHYKLHLVPFRVDEAPLHGSMELFLSSKHWIDASGGSLDRHLALLRQAVTGVLAERAGRPPEREKAGASGRRSVEPPPLPPELPRQTPRPWRLRWLFAAAGWSLAVALTVAGTYNAPTTPPPSDDPPPAREDARPTPPSTPPPTPPPEPAAAPPPEPAAGGMDDAGKEKMKRYLDDLIKRQSLPATRSHLDYFIMLPGGGSQRVTFEVEANRSYTVAAVCGDECRDVDLIVSDDGGKEIGRDLLDNDTPRVRFTTGSGGAYSYTVKIVTCKASECQAGVAVLSAPR